MFIPDKYFTHTKPLQKLQKENEKEETSIETANSRDCRFITSTRSP